MPSTKWGIHLGNGVNVGFDEVVLQTNFQCFTLLHTEAEYIPALRRKFPDALIEVRFYLPNWSAINSIDWANLCSTIYNTKLAPYNCHVTPANEMNLPNEGGGWTYDWYKNINNWLLNWFDQFYPRVNIQKENVHFPAMAYGHSDDQNDYGYVGYEICRDAVEQFGIVDCHPYWFQMAQVNDTYYGQRYRKVHDLFPDKKIYCSELGNFFITRNTAFDEFKLWFDTIENVPYIIGATPFIWCDPTGAHEKNDWQKNKELITRVQSYLKTTVSPVQNDDLISQFPQLYAEWVTAGGIKNNFRKHALGVGAIQPVESDTEFLINELQSDINQLKRILNV